MFIYHRFTLADESRREPIPVALLPNPQATALAWQATLQAQHTGLNKRLLRRPEAADGLLTWMQIEPTAVAAPPSPRMTPHKAPHKTPRHIEVFTACAS